MKKFYELIPNGYAKDAGVVYAPEDWPDPIACDGKPVKNWNEHLRLELRDGKYTPYSFCIGGANLVDEELKELFKSFIGDDPNVEFLPVPVLSKEYGDRTYYIIHFKKVYSNTIDKENSDYVCGELTRYGLKYDKVKDLKIFVAQPDSILVCPAVMTAMKKKNLNFATVFHPIWCYGNEK